MPDELQELGSYLRDCRESLHLERKQIASTLRIRPLYLEALEHGNITTLPGKTYARGYLQRYAEHLGLDTQAILQRYDRLNAPPPSPITPLTASPSVEVPVASAPIIIPWRMVGAGLAVLLIAIWYFFSPGHPIPGTQAQDSNEPAQVEESDAVRDCLVPMLQHPSLLCFTSVMQKPSPLFGATIERFSAQPAFVIDAL